MKCKYSPKRFFLRKESLQNGKRIRGKCQATPLNNITKSSNKKIVNCILRLTQNTFYS